MDARTTGDSRGGLIASNPDATTHGGPDLTRLAILTSHPVQYYAPLFRELAQHIDLHVFFAHEASAQQQAEAGFGTAFDWDINLRDGYSHSFLRNVARHPNASRFSGCDTPEIGDRLRDGRFDAVLAIGWHLKSLLQGILAAKNLGLPVMMRGDSQLGLTSSRTRVIVKEFAYPWLMRAFDAALYVGARNRDYYRHYRYPEERLFHSPHAIDTERFAAGSGPKARTAMRERLGLKVTDKAVLFAGKLMSFKRPLDAVRTVAAVRAAGAPAVLTIAGSGPLEAEVFAEAKRLEVPTGRLGFLNQSEMPAAYAAADALLLPSTARETWGLVANEALACGVPLVVSNDAGCAPDLCADGHVGRSYAGGNSAEAAAALISLFSAPPEPHQVAVISNQFTLRRAADGVAAALDVVMAR